MKTLLTALLLSLFLTTVHAEEKKAVDPRSFSGEYSFNPTCTDEMAIVNVTFRKAPPDETIRWRADGTMDNSFHGTKITFTGAAVSIEPDGSVVVDAQFFGFQLSGKDLTWRPNYSRYLEKWPPSPPK
jgi:hypothetical protein